MYDLEPFRKKGKTLLFLLPGIPDSLNYDILWIKRKTCLTVGLSFNSPCIVQDTLYYLTCQINISSEHSLLIEHKDDPTAFLIITSYFYLYMVHGSTKCTGNYTQYIDLGWVQHGFYGSVASCLPPCTTNKQIICSLFFQKEGAYYFATVDKVFSCWELHVLAIILIEQISNLHSNLPCSY